MDIRSEVLVHLQGAGHSAWTRDDADVLCFEDGSVIGFVHVFETAALLLDTWPEREARTLEKFSPELRLAGEKAWNVYTVLLTAEAVAPEIERRILSIEEELRLTRKIARSVSDPGELHAALLPLLPIWSVAMTPGSGLDGRLRKAVFGVLPESIATMFLEASSPEAVAQAFVDVQ